MIFLMLRRILFFLFFTPLFFSQLFAQNYCEMNRFDEFIFDSVQIEYIDNILYGEAIDQLGDTQKLKLDIYKPFPIYDTLEKKPLIMFVHGGGLVGGDKESEGAADLGYLYGQLGFVFASIDYRIGWNNGDEITGCGGDTVDLNRATYRAVQDTRAAYRYLKANAALYGIDTNFIFVEGNSAGSTVLLYCLYAEQEDFDQQFYDELGSIDTAVNELTNYGFEPDAFIGEASGFPNLNLFIDEYFPSMYFHGTCDSIVPYFDGPLFFCEEPFINPIYYGSWEQTELMKELNREYHFYTGEGASHDVVIPDSLVIYSQDFLKEILCDDLSTKEIYRVLGKKKCAVENNGELFIVQIFPNPVNDIIHLTVTGSRDKDIDLSIFNSMGQIVLLELIDFYPPIRSYEIDISILPRGVYYMKVSQRQEEYVAKFIK